MNTHTQCKLPSMYQSDCGKRRKRSKSCRDLDVGSTIPNIELVSVIFIYYNVFKFHVHTDTHTDSD